MRASFTEKAPSIGQSSLGVNRSVRSLVQNQVPGMAGETVMPAVTAFVGTFFVDEIGDIVERTYYPNDPAGQALSLTRALLEGLKTAVLAIIVYLSCAPLLLTGIGFIALFVANSYLLGREYFLLAAMRFHSSNEARALWRQHSMSLYIAGMVIAFVVSIPVLNFVTPIFAMAFMVHMHKRIAPSRIEIVAPQRPLLKE